MGPYSVRLLSLPRSRPWSFQDTGTNHSFPAGAFSVPDLHPCRARPTSEGPSPAWEPGSRSPGSPWNGEVECSSGLAACGSTVPQERCSHYAFHGALGAECLRTGRHACVHACEDLLAPGTRLPELAAASTAQSPAFLPALQCGVHVL